MVVTKQQMPPRSVHPYQTTVIPRSEHQLELAAQQRTKYPWTDESAPPVYQVTGTESSSENAYYVPQYCNGMRSPPSPVYQLPYNTGTWRAYRNVDKVPSQASHSEHIFRPCTSAFSLPICDLDTHKHASNHSSIPPVPITPEVPIIGACGGHCPGFEYVCYYILQVLFVVGILTGMSLSIAGIVLRRTNRNGDLGVLVYIGCLASCVCGVLLGVQCCVRREIRQRKLRANMHIPMHPIQEPTAPTYDLMNSSLPHTQVYRPTTSLCTEEEDVTGIPWWRRTTRD